MGGWQGERENKDGPILAPIMRMGSGNAFFRNKGGAQASFPNLPWLAIIDLLYTSLVNNYSLLNSQTKRALLGEYCRRSFWSVQGRQRATFSKYGPE